MTFSAGIDLGGTKILTAVFDKQWQAVQSQRVETPLESYDSLLSVLVEQIRWIRQFMEPQAIGLGVPGIQDRESGVLRAANITADGHTIRADLEQLCGIKIRLINDSKAFALSEACLGAGLAYDCVLGISLGTGVAAGVVVGQRVLSSAAGMAGEIGHMSIPAITAQQLTLPLIPCACGKTACYETFLCGPGVRRLGVHFFHVDQPVETWVSLCGSGDEDAIELMRVWYELLATMLSEVMLCYDADCVVFGGGLAALPDFVPHTLNALNNIYRLTNHVPDIKLADSTTHSGARGAALYASQCT